MYEHGGVGGASRVEEAGRRVVHAGATVGRDKDGRRRGAGKRDGEDGGDGGGDGGVGACGDDVLKLEEARRTVGGKDDVRHVTRFGEGKHATKATQQGAVGGEEVGDVPAVAME